MMGAFRRRGIRGLCMSNMSGSGKSLTRLSTRSVSHCGSSPLNANSWSCCTLACFLAKRQCSPKSVQTAIRILLSLSPLPIKLAGCRRFGPGCQRVPYLMRFPQVVSLRRRSRSLSWYLLTTLGKKSLDIRLHKHWALLTTTYALI